VADGDEHQVLLQNRRHGLAILTREALHLKL